MADGPGVYCRECQILLYTFQQVAIYETEEKGIIRPSIASQRIPTVYIRRNLDTNDGYSPMRIICRKCEATVASCDADAITQTICYVLKLKNITFCKSGIGSFKEGLHFEKWSKLVVDKLRKIGVKCIKQREFLKEAGARYFSRMGCTCYDTKTIDVTQTAEDMFKRLTKTAMRNYQIEMTEFAFTRNSVVCLPTGSGKTLVATAVMHAMLHVNPEKIAIFIVPTNHLVEQQSAHLRSELPSTFTIVPIFGQMDMDDRIQSIKAIGNFRYDILIGTCECVNRLIEIGTVRVEDACCVVLDEVHEAKNNSSYARMIASIHHPDVQKSKQPLIVGMTASPLDTCEGGTINDVIIHQKIKEKMAYMKCHPCYPCKHDPYENGINHTEDKALTVKRNEEETCLVRHLDEYLSDFIRHVVPVLEKIAPKFGELQEHIPVSGCFDTNNLRGTTRKIEAELDSLRDKDDYNKNDKNIQLGFAAKDHIVQLFAVYELNSAIGHEVAKRKLREMFANIRQGETRDDRNKRYILGGFKEKCENARLLFHSFHSKLKETSKGNAASRLSERYKTVKNIVMDHYKMFKDEARILIFVDMRRTARNLCDTIRNDATILMALNPRYVVGRGLQGDGFGTEEQQEVLADFRRGSTRLIISTTVLEEGLDVPSCNLVLRMVAPVTLKGFIQSRGRASRSKKGFFKIICNNDTEVERQQTYLTAMELQADSIKAFMKTNNSLGRVVERTAIKLDLDEDHGRMERRPEAAISTMEKETEDEEAVNEMIKIMSQEGETTDNCGVQYLDEMDTTDAILHVRFAIFAKDENEYNLAKNNLDKAFDIMDIMVDQYEFRKVPVSNRFGTEYFPEATLKKKFDEGVDEEPFFEKMVTEYFMFPMTFFPPIWLSIKRRRTYFPRSTEVQLSISRTSVGSLKSPTEYVKRQDIGTTSRIRLNKLEDKITLIINDRFNIETTFGDIQEFAILDRVPARGSNEPVLHFYLTLVRPPRLSEIKIQAENDETSPPESKCRVLYYKREETRRIFANCLTYKLEIPNPVSMSTPTAIDSRARIVLRILESSGVTIYYSRIRELNPRCDLPSEDGGIDRIMAPVHSRSKDVNYAMRCLTSAPGFVIDRVTEQFYDFLNRLDQEKATSVLYRLSDAVNKNLFCGLVAQAEIELDRVRNSLSFSGIDESHAFIKRAVLTPTSILFYEPDYVQTNHIIRQYKNNTFIRVNIRDEDGEQLSSLYGRLDEIIVRLQKIMDGGFSIGEANYEYLAASNSQMRGHSCYFVENDGNDIANRIRDRVGDLSKIRNVAKYASRLGLGFSTSKKTIEAESYRETDVKHNNYTFSDGIGLIPKSIADKIRKKLGLTFLPSAFQIRYGGCKGVVSVWDDEHIERHCSPPRLIVRLSMYKYPSDSKDVEVLEYTRPLPLHLNQQVIMLLNNVGVTDNIFMDMLTGEIAEMGKMFVEEEAASTALKTVVSDRVESLLRVRFKFTADPYFRQLMKAIYRLRMKDLRERSRVRVDDDKGRVLIGILDETGLLQYGEVFIQISTHLNDSGAKKRVIVGDIVIMKNPCIHPGDVRTFRGMNHPELRHCVDCVVFPRHGPRPHPNELSGSDLDGDQYHCIWDARLRPTLELYDPMDYTADKPRDLEAEITVTDVIQHTCEYIENDTLGVIDNTHKALADQKGMDDESCLQLAQIHAQAVDAPKTGKWASVPQSIKNMLRVYPDFMMKPDKPSYTSGKVLGQMFRECSKYMNEAIGATERIRMNIVRPDPVLEVEGYAEYREDAYMHFKQYNKELLAIMEMYGIQTEAELMSGQIASVHTRLRNELDDIQKNTRALVKKIVDKYRRKFYENDNRLGRGNRESEEAKKASAWYYVTYNGIKYGDTYMISTHPCFRLATDVMKCDIDKEQHRFLSFPWIVSDSLAKVYEKKSREQSIVLRSLESEITASVKEIFDSLLETMMNTYDEQLNVCRAVTEEIGRVADCLLYGLSCLLLFDEQLGDVSILVIKRLKRRDDYPQMERSEQLNFLKSVKGESHRHVLMSNLDEDARRLTLKLNSRLYKKRASLTADLASALKWITIKKYIFKNKWIFPALRILCSWAMNTGLVCGRIFFLSEYLIPLLFIDHCLKESAINAVQIGNCQHENQKFLTAPLTTSVFGTNDEWDQLLNHFHGQKESLHWDGDHTGRTGRLLCSFMFKGENQLKSPIDSNLQPVFGDKCHWNYVENTKNLDLLASEMKKAYHRLCLHVSASVLLAKVPVEQLFFIKLAAAQRIAGDENGLQLMLHQKSGASVDVQNKMNSREPGMSVKGTGTEAELHLLDACIRCLNREAEIDSKKKRSIRIRGLKDITGAHNLLVEGATSENDYIRLESYFGYKYPHHDGKRLYLMRPASKNQQQPVNPLHSEIYGQFCRHFKQQLNYFNRNYSKEVYGDVELQVKFGRSYLVNPPQAFVEDQTALTVKEITKALERRKIRTFDINFQNALGSRRSTNRGQRQRENSISSSFFSSVMHGREYNTLLRDFVADAEKLGAYEFVESGIKLVAYTGMDIYTARYDSDLTLRGMEDSPIRWIVSDTKRIVKIRPDEAEGYECDIRFIMKTQMEKIVNVDKTADPALYKDFTDAIGENPAEDGERNGSLFIKAAHLDVQYLERYTIHKYRMKPNNAGTVSSMYVRDSEQFTRPTDGKFDERGTKKIREIRIVPPIDAFLDPSTVDAALDGLWLQAFTLSDSLRCRTRDYNSPLRSA